MKYTTLLVLFSAVAICMAFASAADAFFFGGVTLGIPVAPAPAYYYPPAPYYTAPPPYYAYPAPQGYAQPPEYAPPPPVSQNLPSENCREFTRTVIIDGQRQRAYGNACQQPDGNWKIVD